MGGRTRTGRQRMYLLPAQLDLGSVRTWLKVVGGDGDGGWCIGVTKQVKKKL